MSMVFPPKPEWFDFTYFQSHTWHQVAERLREERASALTNLVYPPKGDIRGGFGYFQWKQVRHPAMWLMLRNSGDATLPGTIQLPTGKWVVRPLGWNKSVNRGLPRFPTYEAACAAIMLGAWRKT